MSAEFQATLRSVFLRVIVALTAAGGAAQAQPTLSCDAVSFTRLGLPATRIVSAATVGDDARAGAHCVLRGAVNERTGSDDKPYAIGFEMRLPERWNGRYFHQLNGASDGAFSLQATIDWYDKFRASNSGNVTDLARFYPVPGMAHCGGGPATDRFDAFAALVGWVEQEAQ
jgi:hypothetical protein